MQFSHKTSKTQLHNKKTSGSHKIVYRNW